MKSTQEQVLSKIYGNGNGYAFSSMDFIRDFPRDNIDKALSELVQKGKIRRVARGIYDYPKYSKLLQQNLSPDMEKIAHAYARKFNWQIEVSGDTALNILGLSTQIVGKYIYLSNGPNREYIIQDNIVLAFKKSALKNIGFKYKESSLIVQALRSLGKEHITDTVITKIRSQIDEKMFGKILTDTKTSTDWIYETIKEICKET
ncbi:DUF6088 family protein [Sulfuricurvum sp.]|uniref:DUF6088 family protein n=1 Tax=Sulfuricurvum sp. TaxID=2025608 RepID=UPI00262178DE|nr:DUF6088 family protein [Sulfuricurvum sp.]MDD2267678.1 DUF6088 family protein [Sulfuricurvum sp.]MDD2784115.1 DUF6088 family protein [Sulfuricurvum sp.]